MYPQYVFCFCVVNKVGYRDSYSYNDFYSMASRLEDLGRGRHWLGVF